MKLILRNRWRDSQDEQKEIFMASFLDSIAAGVKGWFKGMFKGMGYGALIGGAAGIVVAIITANPLAILAGMAVGAGTLGSLGATVGMITSVVKHHEASSAQDVAKVAKAAFMQGVQMGQNLPQEQSTQFRDKIEAERAAQALNQRIH